MPIAFDVVIAFACQNDHSCLSEQNLAAQPMTPKPPMPLRRPMVGTGWKMNHSIAQTRDYAARMMMLLPQTAHALDLFVLPPFTALSAAASAFAATGIAIGGQNMHSETSGAFTGEISADMLVEAGCRYVALAHSERLALFGETYAHVGKKVNRAFQSGLTPILCLGEMADDKAQNHADSVIESQITTALADITASALPNLVLAYEPRWAIGASAAAEPAYVADRHGAIRKVLAQHFGKEAAFATRILYGGSVNEDNGHALAALDDVDGLFVGRAAWQPEGFAAMITIVSAAKNLTSSDHSAAS
jgi:triosephosphate isomerase